MFEKKTPQAVALLIALTAIDLMGASSGTLFTVINTISFNQTAFSSRLNTILLLRDVHLSEEMTCPDPFSPCCPAVLFILQLLHNNCLVTSVIVMWHHSSQLLHFLIFYRDSVIMSTRGTVFIRPLLCLQGKCLVWHDC